MDPISFSAAFPFHREAPHKVELPPPIASVIAPPEPVGRVTDEEREALVPMIRDLFPPMRLPSEPCPEDEPKPAPKVATHAPAEPEPPKVRRASRPSTPTSWTLVDRFGQTWTHSDKSYLESWVAQRNAIPTTTAYSYYYQAGSCANGRCSR